MQATKLLNLRKLHGVDIRIPLFEDKKDPTVTVTGLPVYVDAAISTMKALVAGTVRFYEIILP